MCGDADSVERAQLPTLHCSRQTNGTGFGGKGSPEPSERVHMFPCSRVPYLRFPVCVGVDEKGRAFDVSAPSQPWLSLRGCVDLFANTALAGCRSFFVFMNDKITTTADSCMAN